VAQIPWSHNRLIVGKVKDYSERPGTVGIAARVNGPQVDLSSSKKLFESRVIR